VTKHVFIKGFTANDFKIVLVEQFPKKGLRMAVRRLVKALELFFLKQAKENLSIFQKNGLIISVTRLVIVYKLRLDCRHTKIFQESSK
jgi:hypothetical protein